MKKGGSCRTALQIFPLLLSGLSPVAVSGAINSAAGNRFHVAGIDIQVKRRVQRQAAKLSERAVIRSAFFQIVKKVHVFFHFSMQDPMSDRPDMRALLALNKGSLVKAALRNLHGCAFC